MLSSNHNPNPDATRSHQMPHQTRTKSSTSIDLSSTVYARGRVIQNAGPVTIWISQESTTDSQDSVPSMTPVEDDTSTSEDGWLKPNVPQPAEKLPDVQFHYGLPYVQLNDDYNRRLCWSNEPIDLKLPSYFDPDQLNLSKDFNVDGLCPVIKEKDSDTFILRDAKCRYYLWDEWDGHLLRFKDEWTQGFPSKKKLVMNLICNLTWAEEDTDIIYCDRLED
ncbi:Nn.00g018160.m01.CDS01 [Neocucurbitaria sp. VM-36]